MPHNEKSFSTTFSFYFSFYSFEFREQWKKLHWNFFHSILFWLGGFLKTILFQVLARKSLDFVVFRGPLFFFILFIILDQPVAQWKNPFFLFLLFYSRQPRAEWKNKHQNNFFSFYSILGGLAQNEKKKVYNRAVYECIEHIFWQRRDDARQTMGVTRRGICGRSATEKNSPPRPGTCVPLETSATRRSKECSRNYKRFKWSF